MCPTVERALVPPYKAESVVGIDRKHSDDVKARSKEWRAIIEVAERVGTLGADHYVYKRESQTGSFGSVKIVELAGTGVEFAMKKVLNTLPSNTLQTCAH
eukprot:4527770-Pyramimonas_sp.AAC.1